MKKITLTIFINVLILCFAYALTVYIIDREIHPRKITKYRSSVHFLSSSPSHGETVSNPAEIKLQFAYPLTKLTTVSITSGDREDSIGEKVIGDDGKTVGRRLNPAAADAIYTVNYTACFVDNYCDYGYYQFRLKKDIR